ncbi:MAG: hypothetical protein ACOZB1_04025 [Pseudomonadota bacterium]|jgi:hypothetical protein
MDRSLRPLLLCDLCVEGGSTTVSRIISGDRKMGVLLLAQAPGGMTFGMRDQVEVGGCVWQHTAATCIGKGMIRNGIFAGIWLNESSQAAINQHVMAQPV